MEAAAGDKRCRPGEAEAGEVGDSEEMYRSPPRTPDATIDICFTWEDVEDFVLQTPLVSGGRRTGDEEPVPVGVECPLGCKFAEKWPSVVAHSTFLRRPQTPDATLNTLRFMSVSWRRPVFPRLLGSGASTKAQDTAYLR